MHKQNLVVVVLKMLIPRSYVTGIDCRQSEKRTIEHIMRQVLFSYNTIYLLQLARLDDFQYFSVKLFRQHPIAILFLEDD